MGSIDNTANSAHGSSHVLDTNSKKEIPEWPIAPTFLSLRQGCNEDSANYNNDGLYNPFYIRGFLADLSQNEDIQNAVSLFQFVPKDFLPHDPGANNPKIIPTNPRKGTVILNEPLAPKTKEILDEQGKKIIRIDSGTYVNNGRLCDIFRKCDSKHTDFCFMQDSIVGIFADKELNRIDRITDDDKYRKKLDELIAEFNKDRKNDIEKIKYEPFLFDGQKRFCLHYTCRYSLFEEHIFPIYLQGRVIACLMLGQMGREAFDRDKSFGKYRSEMEVKDSEFNKYLLHINKLDNKEWNKKAKTIIESITIFERQLEDKIEHRNNRFINNKFTEIEDIFREKVKVINVKEQTAVLRFTEALNKAFTAIRNTFDNANDSFLRMFALPIDIAHDKLIPIGWSGAEFDAQDSFNFDLKQLHGVDELEGEQQKEKIQESASEKIKDLYNVKEDVLLPGWLAGKEVAYIVWKRHNAEFKKLKNRKTFDSYRMSLKKFYSVALECYSYIRSAKMELLLETTIQEAAHESAHFILPALDVVENNLNEAHKDWISNNYSSEYYAYINRYNKYKDEVLNMLNQLREINYGSSLIYSKDFHIVKKPEQVSFLIYKLTKMLENRVIDSHKHIVYDRIILSTLNASLDAKYFNHALYNLLDNAIKYGYEGSNIRIKLGVDRKSNMMHIEIISYGIKIEEGNRIYNLFERSEDAAIMSGGTGIGLYIVKKICKAHGGDVTHKSEWLSDYNIPALVNYKYDSKLASKASPEEQNKYNTSLNLIPEKIESEVVCNSVFIKYAFYFSSSVYEPTYRNTFRVSIPLN